MQLSALDGVAIRTVSPSALRAWVAGGLTAAIFLCLVLTQEGFLAKNAILSLVVLTSLLGIAALGQTFTVLLGGIDLSIPAVIGMANVLMVALLGAGWPFLISLVLVLVVGGAVGLGNALLTRALEVHPLVVTLAVGLVVGGAVVVLTEGRTSGVVPTGLSSFVSPVGTTGPLPIPGVIVTWIVLSVVAIWAQRQAAIGREILATGSNSNAAGYALVSSTRVWSVAYVVSGMTAALTGILLAGFTGTAQIDIGQPYLFTTVAAVVVGGTSLTGGSGGYGLTILGAFIIVQLRTLLVGFGMGLSSQDVIIGVVVVLLVVLYGREPHVRNRI